MKKSSLQKICEFVKHIFLHLQAGTIIKFLRSGLCLLSFSNMYFPKNTEKLRHLLVMSPNQARSNYQFQSICLETSPVSLFWFPITNCDQQNPLGSFLGKQYWNAFHWYWGAVIVASDSWFSHYLLCFSYLNNAKFPMLELILIEEGWRHLPWCSKQTVSLENSNVQWCSPRNH